MWRFAYLGRQTSIENKLLIPMHWFKVSNSTIDPHLDCLTSSYFDLCIFDIMIFPFKKSPSSLAEISLVFKLYKVDKISIFLGLLLGLMMKKTIFQFHHPRILFSNSRY